MKKVNRQAVKDEKRQLIQAFDAIENAIRLNTTRKVPITFQELTQSIAMSKKQTVTKTQLLQIIQVWPKVYQIRHTCKSQIPDIIIDIPAHAKDKKGICNTAFLQKYSRQ